MASEGTPQPSEPPGAEMTTAPLVTATESRLLAGQPWWFWWVGISAALVCVGSIGPWASLLFISVSGTKGDGQITLVLGLAALILVAVYALTSRRPRPAWPLILIVLAGLGAGGTGAYDWANLQRAISDAESEDNIFSATISVEWGLVLMTIAGFSLALAAFITYLRRSREPAPVARAPASGPPVRECPHCKEQMRRDASVCQHCRLESEAWMLDRNYWWVKRDGRWLYLDEAANEWRPSAPAEQRAEGVAPGPAK